MKNINLHDRVHTQFTSTISGEKDGEVQILGYSLLLGRNVKSKKTVAFVDLVLKLLVDHGPYQSGAINTIIASRAGKDLVSSLTSGLLTIGPKFGGAVNNAAKVWFKGVNNRSNPAEIVENFAKRKEHIPGIGHRKYRLEIPDPRVLLIKQKGLSLAKHQYLNLALSIEKITTGKKANLILNVDGAMAAVLLDLLANEEGINNKELELLIRIEFFNALFILSRSVGYVGHYLDQKRLNEPLFRLEPDQVFSGRTAKNT